MYESQPFKIFSYVILKIFLQGLFLNSFSQNCECARMQYLEHYDYHSLFWNRTSFFKVKLWYKYR